MEVAQLKTLIDKIKSAKSVDDLDKIKDEIQPRSDYQSLDDKYPKIGFQITANDIKDLEQQNILRGVDFKELNQEGLKTPLEKLLYAVLWKQGDLVKLKHIIEGIKSTEKSDFDKKEALVFFQFGKFLGSENEPIIDQHVLRAFGIFKTEDEHKIEEYRKMELIEFKHKSLIEDYKQWLNKLPLNKNQDALFKIDRILMSIGKKIKYRNKKNL